MTTPSETARRAAEEIFENEFGVVAATDTIQRAIDEATAIYRLIAEENRRINYDLCHRQLPELQQQLDEARRDKERLLNVLEHCALPPDKQPENHHEVAAMVVRDFRPAIQQQKGQL